MSVAVQAPPTHPEATQAPTVSVKLDELIVGRPLQSPIYDEKGVLLLAAGNLITSDFKRLLHQRGEGTVRVAEADVHRVRLTLAVDEEVVPLKLDGETAARLDKVIDAGLLSVQNQGPAAKDRVVYHGKKAYNLERHAVLQDQRQAASESVGSMMKAALSGRSVDSRAVTQMAAEFLTDLADDSDQMLCAAMEASREASIAEHSLKMATLGMALGVELGLDEDNCRKICVAGLVHDWGMGAVPAELRQSPKLLSEHQMFQVRKHPIHTVEMLERMPGVPSVVPMVAYQVHEKPNGLGYPRGRVGDRIHLFARILAVADVYSALTEQRPYRHALMPYAAMECVVKLARNKELDPEIVRALLKVLTLFPIGSFVALDDGRVGRVIRRNADKYATPIVQVVQDAQGERVTPDRPDSLVDLAMDPVRITQALPTPGREEYGLTVDVLCVRRPVV